MSGRPLSPRRRDGAYVVVSLALGASLDGLDVAATVLEDEGVTCVVPEARALARGLTGWRCAWLTLELDTALDEVGVTARFAAALAAVGIACNVLAGAHHDHLLVPTERADEALRVLADLSL